jgi:hypothetical protein
MSWKSWDFPLQYQDFLHLKSNFPHLKSDFPHTKSDLPKSAFYFLQWLYAFFNGFLTFFNGFPLSPTAFRFSPTAFRFSSTAFHFPRILRKFIHGEKYTKDCYSSFVFFATRSPSFVIPAKQYLHLTQHHYVMFEADIHFRPLHTSTLDKYKVFEPLLCCLKGMWVHPYTVTLAKLAQI